MRTAILTGLLILLTSCSGVSKVCDKNGICLETWSHVSVSSSVTIAQLRTEKGNPVTGTTIENISNGWIADVDPFASDITTTANEVHAMQGF